MTSPSRVRALQAKGTIHSRVGGGGCLKKPGVSEKGRDTPDVFTQKFTPIPFLHLISRQSLNAPNTVRLRTPHEHQREKETPEPLTSAEASGKGKIRSWERSVQDVTWAGQ